MLADTVVQPYSHFGFWYFGGWISCTSRHSPQQKSWFSFIRVCTRNKQTYDSHIQSSGQMTLICKDENLGTSKQQRREDTSIQSQISLDQYPAITASLLLQRCCSLITKLLHCVTQADRALKRLRLLQMVLIMFRFDIVDCFYASPWTRPAPGQWSCSAAHRREQVTSDYKGQGATLDLQQCQRNCSDSSANMLILD